MKIEIAQALLLKVLENADAEEIEDNRKYFQTMAKYKYDDYQQFSPGMRFIERLALWLEQFKPEERKTALSLIKDKLIFISQQEMHLLVNSCFPDLLRNLFIKDISVQLRIPEYFVNTIVNRQEYKILLRQSIFCGMSDGARIEIFRRANSGTISHEQIYQTYELSNKRVEKMKDELLKDLRKYSADIKDVDGKFKQVFLLDDFSASGTSYLKYNTETKVFKGKIAAFCENIFEDPALKDVFNIDNLNIYIVIYLCTEQAKNQIEQCLPELEKKYRILPKLLYMHLIPNDYKLNEIKDEGIVQLCNDETYYDAEEIEDEHTKNGGSNVKLGFGKCALPLILSHNTPNNSVPLLWSYETSEKFKGLFPRIPRHKEL